MKIFSGGGDRARGGGKYTAYLVHLCGSSHLVTEGNDRCQHSPEVDFNHEDGVIHLGGAKLTEGRKHKY